MKLAIIGNGFDLGNGLKTSLNDFREWMQEKHSSDYLSFCETFNVFDDNWNDIETKMGSSYDSIENAVMEIVSSEVDSSYDEDYDGKEWKRDDDVNHAIEYAIEDRFISSERLNSLLKEWIESIDDSSIIHKHDLTGWVVVNFNYTTYADHENTFHPHGSVFDDELKFGHSKISGDNPEKTDYGNSRISHGMIFDSFNKSVNDNVIRLKAFLSKYDITQIHFIGFSLGAEDRVYLSSLPTICECYFYWFTEIDVKRANELLMPIFKKVHLVDNR